MKDACVKHPEGEHHWHRKGSWRLCCLCGAVRLVEDRVYPGCGPYVTEEAVQRA